MLSYKGYLGQVEFDPDAKVFYGRVLNTRDTITFQSEQAATLEEEFQTSIDTYLAFCEELGEAPEKPYSGKFVLRLSPEGHRAVALAAQLAHKSLNAWAAEHLVEIAQEELEQAR
ncbi:toxin-antitoxin system HicB family antitoxin [candidate division KSB3 bacterium]|uniref:Toxin-antitoxin system HicB family antitoxin n=1 Tax=candidate division KSB3 bacterium TaxID=2044937 RepID=A0A9D5Q555_9BACT|nr:toxin-antitoxin system HicB family antitoxin [candidate division KSB3 bacterium]MBD3323907.1 toxin-antitoxin system HicB family antitoxin [candidate division KSB3 bacterium]